MQKSVTILGATGSIGASTLDLIGRNPDTFRIEALTAQSKVDELANLARKFNARLAVIGDESLYPALKEALSGSGIACAAGQDGLNEAAARKAGLVVSAIVGSAGIDPTFAAISAENTVALANKESLVAAGDLMMSHARAMNVAILPMDSEHNALAQAMAGHNIADVEHLTITASGGPFRTWDAATIANAQPEQALKHPNWAMGAKITIDSASLMNKGLELIEAHHLFNMSPEKLKVVVHPQSIIHGLVHYKDGSVLAHMGPHDMRVPIAHCLGFPDRIASPVNRLDLVALGQLTFEAPDMMRFPCLRLAIEAMREGGAMPAIMNAANEVAVAAFLARRIAFGGIARLVEQTMLDLVVTPAPHDLAALHAIDHMARDAAQHLL